MRSNGIDQIVELKEIRQAKTIVDQFLVGIIAYNIDVLSLGPFLY